MAKAAGVTRQTIYNWSADYGHEYQLAVAAGTDLASLPVQRPQAVKGAPALILGTRRKGRLMRDGRRGKAAGTPAISLRSPSPGRSWT